MSTDLYVKRYMKNLGFSLFVAMTICWTGCAKDKSGFENNLKSLEEISYYDRNGDGKVDEEKHHYRGIADMDWELLDDNYDGKYEKKVLYGFAVTESAVNLRVPKNVRIEPKS